MFFGRFGYQLTWHWLLSLFDVHIYVHIWYIFSTQWAEIWEALSPLLFLFVCNVPSGKLRQRDKFSLNGQRQVLFQADDINLERNELFPMIYPYEMHNAKLWTWVLRNVPVCCIIHRFSWLMLYEVTQNILVCVYIEVSFFFRVVLHLRFW